MNTEMEMPKYRSHKVVWALKIKHIDGLMMTPEEEEYGVIQLTQDYIDKHRPEEGGYFVVYEDGYRSWSPAKAFEAGYSRVS